ncbi:uncharacterized protein LOC123680922 [Harmonia axyridis]|uniref:uncharacterized protein LOC123680922 n=1 Tax=Harmonia axyridis TaxID=115357 RepID=UPI001E275ECB|nr:uncharacterized protein LOC123680922 [Harmonia axyridis]
MKISSDKTKCMVISKEPVRCKLELEGVVIQQTMSFKYLGVEITSHRHLYSEVQQQATKAAQITGYLNTMVWQNKYMLQETKVRLYKAMVRPIMTYAVETRAETERTKQKLRTIEMRILRRISGVTLRDRQTNKSIRQRTGVQDVVKWSRQRRRDWRDHVDRMESDRIAYICKNEQPRGRRKPGRPPKRWAQSWFSSSAE